MDYSEREELTDRLFRVLNKAFEEKCVGSIGPAEEFTQWYKEYEEQQRLKKPPPAENTPKQL